MIASDSYVAFGLDTDLDRAMDYAVYFFAFPTQQVWAVYAAGDTSAPRCVHAAGVRGAYPNGSEFFGTVPLSCIGDPRALLWQTASVWDNGTGDEIVDEAPDLGIGWAGPAAVEGHRPPPPAVPYRCPLGPARETVRPGLAPPPATPAAFEPAFAPTRVYDTRISTDSYVCAGETRRIPVAAHHVEGTTAVAINLTVTNAGGPGYWTAFPAAMTRPNTSNVNVIRAGQSIANMAILPITEGAIDVYTQSGGDLIIDLLGVFKKLDYPLAITRTAFSPSAPVRVLDTRTFSKPKFAARETRLLRFSPPAGIAPGQIYAAMINVTAVEAEAEGYVSTTSDPAGGSVQSSIVNYGTAGDVAPNLAIVPLTAGVDTTYLFSSAPAHVLVDVVGFFVPPAIPGTAPERGLFVPLSPARLLDSRGSTKFAAGETRAVPQTGRAGIPATGVASVVTTVTATQSSRSGFVSTWASGLPRPNTSTVNVVGVESTRANASVVAVGADGAINLYAEQPVHLLQDVSGYFTG